MKYFLLLFILTIFTNVSYASFPVDNNMHNEIIQSESVNSQDPLANIGKTSLILSLLGVILMVIQGFLGPNDFIAGYFLFGLLLLIIAFIFFIIWTTNKKWSKWFWLSFLALSLFLPLVNKSEASWLNN